MMQFTFVVPGKPIPQPRHRSAVKKGRSGFNSHVEVYLPKNDPVHAYKQAVRLAAKMAIPKGWDISLPIQIDMAFIFARPKSVDRIHHTVAPDADNCAKSVMDSLKNLVWVDDAQVWSCLAGKMYEDDSHHPSTVVVITGG